MDTAQLLTDAFTRTHEDVQSVTDGLDAAALAYRVDAEANSIAWLVWHTARIQDDHVAELAGREQIWTADGWADRFGLPFPTSDTGFGHRTDQVASVRPDHPDLLVGYHDAVHRATVGVLATLSPGDLDEIVDDRYDPPVSVGVRLVSVVHDGMQHLGQAAFVRGLFERGDGGATDT